MGLDSRIYVIERQKFYGVSLEPLFEEMRNAWWLHELMQAELSFGYAKTYDVGWLFNTPNAMTTNTYRLNAILAYANRDMVYHQELSASLHDFLSKREVSPVDLLYWYSA